ncbi:PREDICTED: NADH-cytochrome b5 reductase-like isoform X1 [Crocodylus porosus]|uniref:NADH-cytochrome b5 reductase-like isoform X1 n=1 Tax=Crocodylus porosus TaxID=8502 RepID=UPI00093947AD|nr:PREDICTED: NADH-cytochrome b5 reductase-like isoform X1 [Crocodylus porosus]
MSESEDDWLALKPREPLPSQCCGSGCKPCISDLYQKELAQWEKARAKKDKSLLSKQKEQRCNSELNPDTFTAFNINSVEQLTQDTYLYRFELPENSSLGLSLGQHVVLRGEVNGLEVQRAYTPISPVNAEGYFDVLIKCYASGLMSQYIKSWKKGETIFWRGPFGGFPYRPNQYGELLMLASGTGLAPMLPILQYVTENEDDETFITLVGCFRTFENIYLKPLLQDLSRYWNVRMFYILSQLTIQSSCYNILSQRGERRLVAEVPTENLIKETFEVSFTFQCMLSFSFCNKKNTGKQLRRICGSLTHADALKVM